MTAETSGDAVRSASPPGLGGAGLLLASMEVHPDREAEFDAWYTHEHLYERVTVPGFVSGRRYLRRPQDRGKKHLTVYVVDHPDVLASREYIDRLNQPTVRTQAIADAFQSISRTVLRVEESWGEAVARELVVVELDIVDVDAVMGLVREDLALRLLSDGNVTSVHLGVADENATRAKTGTAEAASVGRPDETVGGVLLVEGVRHTNETVREVLAHGVGKGARMTEPAGYELLVHLDGRAARRRGGEGPRP